MNHHDIHEIIEQISQTLDCPQCKTRILPNNIVITHNRSSQMIHDRFVDEPISIDDVQTIKYELAHFCGSFIEAFSR